MPSPARVAALRILRNVSQPGGTLAEAFSTPQVARLDERDRALLHELVLGTLRRRGWLDDVIGRLIERPLDEVAPRLLDSLRLGAYQLLFTRVAPHAAVSETVELARTAEPRAGGFANAVMRRLQREGSPPEPETGDALRWLTGYGSLPQWLASRWLERLGAQRAVARARTLLEQPPTHLRLNPRFSDAEARLAETGVRVAPAYVPGALELVEGRLQPLLDAGVAYAQDAGSQLVARLAASEGRVLDACAAPGGKSLLVADLGAGRTRVVAQEASQRRVRTLRRICSRWGTAAVSVVAGDALRPPFAVPFDAVLLDAPCSGLGTLARHPDIRWRSQPGDLQRHAARQGALLESVSKLVRRGGRLVYATCSIEPEENEAVVAPFLAAHPEFASEPLPEWCVPFADGPFVRVEPQPGRGDSFFAAALRRVREAAL